MTVRLLDSNALTALCLEGHKHHRRVRAWLAGHDDRIATCPITQGTLLRLHMRFAEDPNAEAAWRTLRLVCASRATSGGWPTTATSTLTRSCCRGRAR